MSKAVQSLQLILGRLGETWYSLGRVLEKNGDLDSALGALDRATELEPEDMRAGSLAAELRKKGAKPKSPKLRIDTAQGHNAAGAERSRAGDFSGAIAEFLRSLEMQPDYAEARYNLAIAMYQANQREGAELELRKVLLLRSDAASHCAGTVAQGQRRSRRACRIRDGPEAGSTSGGGAA